MDREKFCLIKDSAIVSGPSGVYKIKRAFCSQRKLFLLLNLTVYFFDKLTVAVQGPLKRYAGLLRPAAKAVVEIAGADLWRGGGSH